VPALDLATVAARALALGAPIPRVLAFVEVGSTQDEAAAQARSGAPAGTLVLASRQASGRGRLGRSWHSPDGGLYASLVLRPGGEPGCWPALAVRAGTAAASALSAAGVAGVRVKWPNDLLVGGRKVAGILAEAWPAEGFAVLGLGLNVAFPDGPPADLRDLATDLAAHLPSGDATEACGAVLAAVASAVVPPLPDPPVDGAAATAWLDRDRVVSVGNLRGRPEAIDERGELLLRLADGTGVRVRTGELDER
jgi:BirA family transcriptional regulator, biotin operon repressor / biotin---[acetyl-CoA-carboxylase] ligase